LVGRFGSFKGPGILVVPIDEGADISFELPALEWQLASLDGQSLPNRDLRVTSVLRH
jgi:hypothetical protein